MRTRLTISIAAFAMMAIAALCDYTTGRVSGLTAKRRYPWNGKVDMRFTIAGESGTKYYTSFTAKDEVGGTNIAMNTIRKTDGLATKVVENAEEE